jgi:cytidylate kinase
MQPTTSGETYGSAQLVEKQMLFKHVRDLMDHKRPSEEASSRFRYITISRRRGSLGDAIAQELAGHLGWHICDREIVDQIAKDSKVRQNLVQQLDEKTQSVIQDSIQRLLQMAEGISFFGLHEYHEALLKTIAYLAARGDAIIVGRGSNFALRDDPLGLHIRIFASPEVCAQRLSQRWEVSPKEALRRMIESENERRNFVRLHFYHDIEDLRSYDLICNTDRMTVPQVVASILSALGLPP